jgi:hypothetical protein
VREQSAHANCPAGWRQQISRTGRSPCPAAAAMGIAGRGGVESRAGVWQWGCGLRWRNGCLSSLGAPACPSPPAGRRCPASRVTRNPAGMQHTHSSASATSKQAWNTSSKAQTRAGPASGRHPSTSTHLILLLLNLLLHLGRLGGSATGSGAAAGGSSAATGGHGGQLGSAGGNHLRRGRAARRRPQAGSGSGRACCWQVAFSDSLIPACCCA